MLFDLKLQRGQGLHEQSRDPKATMATEDGIESATGAVVLAQGTLPASTASSPSSGIAPPGLQYSHEAPQLSDQPQLSKHHRHANGRSHSSSLLLYRKLSNDGAEKTPPVGEPQRLDRDSTSLAGSKRLYQEVCVKKGGGGAPNAGSTLAEDGSEGSPCPPENQSVDVGQQGASKSPFSSPCPSPNSLVNSLLNSSYSRKSSPSSNASSPNQSPRQSPGQSPGPSSPKSRHIRRGSLPVSVLALRRPPSPCGPVSEPGSPESLRANIQLTKTCCNLHRNARTVGHRHTHHLKEGYSSLERLNRRPRRNKCSLDKLFLPRASTEIALSGRTSLGKVQGTSPGETEGSSSSSDDEVGVHHDGEFVRNRKERNTLLMRRFMKNNQKVTKSVLTGTRAIVRTLPSGKISDEVWKEVMHRRTWQPGLGEIRQIVSQEVLTDSLRLCRGILRYIGLCLPKVIGHVVEPEAENLTHPCKRALLDWPGCVYCKVTRWLVLSPGPEPPDCPPSDLHPPR